MEIRNKFIVIVSPFIIFIQAFYPNTVMADRNINVIQNELNQLLENEQDLNGAIAGISIRSAANGRLLYEHSGDLRLRPASNLKLLTAACALSVLGENHTFPTEIRTSGQIKKGIITGSLYIKGKGDPTLLKADFDEMADKLQKSGIKMIKGDLVGDDSWFDNIRYPLDLPWSDETAYYGAPISALTASPTVDFDAGTVVIEIRPGKEIGSRALTKVIPETTAVVIVNNTVTVPADVSKKLIIEREHGKKKIIIDGLIPINSKKDKEWISVRDPAEFALDLFHQSLASHDIRVNGKIKTGTVPENSRVIFVHHSTPLSQLLIPFMKLSNNGHGEILIKEMGKVKEGSGSWEAGLHVCETELTQLGINPKTMVLRDGSGVSHVDLVPANQITQLLYNIQEKNWFSAYLQSLPIGGKTEKLVGGTLRNRLKSPDLQGKVKAKTGTISTVSSLSGYVDAKSGQRYVFSILLNNLLDEERGKQIEDKIVTILASQ